jgi:hypothetical protein
MVWLINTLFIVKRNIKTEVEGRTEKNTGRNEHIRQKIQIFAWNRVCFEENIHTRKRPHRLRASSDSYSMAIAILLREQDGRGAMLTAHLV